MLAHVRPRFEDACQRLVEQTVKHAYYATARQPAVEKALTAAEQNLRAVANQLTKRVRDGGILDREFDQFGQNALKTVFKEMSVKVASWVAAVALPDGQTRESFAEPEVDRVVETLAPLVVDFAKLDGYNVWRKSIDARRREGKLAPSGAGDPTRQPMLSSWIVPVREWADLEIWGENPETGEVIARPTHQDGSIDPEYLAWLRDVLKVFDDDATVRKEYLERLDPDCLEALDFNLSAGRHKPFVFDAGQHRPPAELIGELQAIHAEVQERIRRLLTMVVGGQ